MVGDEPARYNPPPWPPLGLSPPVMVNPLRMVKASTLDAVTTVRLLPLVVPGAPSCPERIVGYAAGSGWFWPITPLQPPSSATPSGRTKLMLVLPSGVVGKYVPSATSIV